MPEWLSERKTMAWQLTVSGVKSRLERPSVTVNNKGMKQAQPFR